MPIEIDNPITEVPPPITYKEIWLDHVHILGSGYDGGPYALTAEFSLVGRLPSGHGVRKGDFNRTLSLPDIFAPAVAELPLDPQLIGLLNAQPTLGNLAKVLTATLIGMAKAGGVLAVETP